MTEPTEPDEYEAFFHANLPLIEKLLGAIAHRYGLRGDDAEEYRSLARARLWEDEYAVLRKWRRESKLSTYLAVVLTNLAHEFRIRRNGRWRASAAAVRLGHLAVHLEKLVYHHGMRLEEAGEWLRTRGETTLTNRDLVALLGQLPLRTPPRRPDEPEPVIDELPAEGSSDGAVLAAEEAEERRATLRALHAAIGRLPAQEQVVIRMYFFDGQTLAGVARALRVDQKPLYRVKDAALRTLRGLLLAQGITPERLHRLLGGELAPRDDPDEGDGPDAGEDAGGPVRDGIGGLQGGKSGGPRLSNETWGTSQPTEPRAAAPPTPDSSGGRSHE